MPVNMDVRKQCASHLVSLIINQDHVAQGWIKFLITIEASLAVALAFILKPGIYKSLPVWFTPRVTIVIPIFGILSTIALTIIVVRERNWQAWYVQKFKNLPNFPEVFPPEQGGAGSVWKQPIGFISKVIILFALLIIITWCLIIKALWF